jgi:hypothetical protein
MHHENTEMLTGITAYLRSHFPEVEFTIVDDVKAKHVVFRGDGPLRYRLEITDRFLKGEDGVATSLSQLDKWEVAKALREAKGKPVTLATTGLHTKLSRQWPPSLARR